MTSQLTHSQIKLSYLNIISQIYIISLVVSSYISYLWLSAQKQLISPGVRRGVSQTYTVHNLMKPVSDANQ